METDWDFYSCNVDDAPASIFLDLALWKYSANAAENTLYIVDIKMAHPNEHGMGANEEADALYPVEDEISAAAQQAGMLYIGRVRNNGLWQLTFMGPPDLTDALTHLATAALASTNRAFEIITQKNSSWSYYRDFLFPNAERMQWIQDRRVVESLASNGDPLTAPRRVDHWAYFPNTKTRATFAKAVKALEFETIELEARNDDTEFGLQFHRVDSVQLNDIHEIIITLNELAEQHQGTYDGWETIVMTSDPN